MCALLNSWRKWFKRQESKDDSNRLSTDRKRRAGRGRGDSTGRDVNTVWEKTYKMPICHTAAWNDSYLSLLWITTTTLLTPFIFPVTSDSPKTSFLLQEWWLLSCNLWNKQLLKEGCTESSVDLQVMQLSQKRIIHRTILWNRRMGIRCWTITISFPCMFGSALSTTLAIQKRWSTYLLGKKKQAS